MSKGHRKCKVGELRQVSVRLKLKQISIYFQFIIHYGGHVLYMMQPVWVKDGILKVNKTATKSLFYNSIKLNKGSSNIQISHFIE